MCIYLAINNNNTMNAKLKVYLSAYEALEAKQENGTITDQENRIRLNIYEVINDMLFNK